MAEGHANVKGRPSIARESGRGRKERGEGSLCLPRTNRVCIG